MAIAFLFVLLVVVVSVPLAIWAPVYLFEDIYIIDALKKPTDWVSLPGEVSY